MQKNGCFQKEKLFCGIICAKDYPRAGFLEDLERMWGPCDFVGPSMRFDFTKYYEKEMGIELKRFLVSFQDLADPSTLSEKKRQAILCEQRHVRNAGRQVNIDPGMLSPDRIVLASTKNNRHRIPLSDGIYGDLTLLYYCSGYHALPWTYADYQSEALQQQCLDIREKYLQQLKQFR